MRVKSHMQHSSSVPRHHSDSTSHFHTYAPACGGVNYVWIQMLTCPVTAYKINRFAALLGDCFSLSISAACWAIF